MLSNTVKSKIDELITVLEEAKRPKQDIELGLFIIDLKLKVLELEELYR